MGATLSPKVGYASPQPPPSRERERVSSALPAAPTDCPSTSASILDLDAIATGDRPSGRFLPFFFSFLWLSRSPVQLLHTEPSDVVPVILYSHFLPSVILPFGSILLS